MTDLAALLDAGIIEPGQGWVEHLDFPGYLIGLHGAVITTLGKTPKVMSPISLGKYDGYQLKHRDGKIVKRYRHRLVAEAVYGPCPAGHECRHLDGDRSNADFTNLRWGTRVENNFDKRSHGTLLHGEAHPASKLKKSDVDAMKAMRAQGIYFHEIAKQFNVAVMTAHRAITGESWGGING